tara:strand:- start:5617 stop:6762 length:1146 start_codon:yes stop_codon:yes gene_type:complete
VAKEKYRKIKKNVLIISLFDFNSKHKFYFLNKLNKSFNIYSLSLKNYIKDNSLKNLKKKLNMIVKNKKLDYYFDLLPIPDHQYKSKLYKQNLLKYFEVRKILNESDVKSIRIVPIWLNKWMLFPYKYFISFRNLYRYFKNLISENVYNYPKTNYSVICSDFSLNNEKYFNSKKIYLHHHDYLKHKDINYNIGFKNLKKKNFIVYLDQNLGSTNFDIKLIDKNYDFKFNNLYRELNNFFDLVEDKLRTEVVIALHPRRSFSKANKIFNNRKLFKNLSAELIYFSRAALIHDTMSVNFAIINSKPFSILTSDELENSLYKKSINYYASFFEKKKINISKNANLSIKNFFYVDKEKYNLYTKQCIIPSKARSYNVNNVFKKILY